MFKQSPPHSICIVRLSAIGDTCHTLAVIRAIQDTWPESKVTWIIGKTEAGLMADIPDIELIIFDKRKGPGAYREVRTQLDGRTFDAVLCMHASMRANWLYRLIDSPVRLGYDFKRARDFQWLFTNLKIAAESKQHVLDGMLSFAEYIGVPADTERPLRWDIPLSPRHREYAEARTAGDQPVLLISPCSSQRARNFRNWSAENYAATIKHAQQKHNCKVILSGGRTELELEYSRIISRLTGRSVVNLIGQTTLKQLFALIAASDVLLCPDSGPAHMATAAGTPVIGLYATSNPDRSGPYLSRDLTVNAYPDAVGRYLGKSVSEIRWGRRVRNPGAMALIRVTDVNEKIDQIFDK